MRIDLSCSYKHPGGLRVTKSFWFANEQPGVGPVDLLDDDQYKERVQYKQNQLYHTVTITHLRASDAQTYWFRFITDDPGGKYFGRSGVSLSVTGLKTEVSDTQGGGKQLICSSTCTLTNPTYIWYRNEQPVSERNRAVLYLRDRTVDAGSYSCAVKEHEEIRSAAVYSPKDTRAVVLPSGERKEGDSVTLTCSSDADPPVLTFNWFKQSVNESLGTGQNYSITNISSQHSGLYYCTALNQLGQHSSAPARLDVFCKCSLFCMILFLLSVRSSVISSVSHSDLTKALEFSRKPALDSRNSYSSISRIYPFKYRCPNTFVLCSDLSTAHK
uniref:Ig-like domain-containing protein n=1 Tax=Astyanax mexicanus TaxID=7994 RepID=A0A3B1IRH3_ASTMX